MRIPAFARRIGVPAWVAVGFLVGSLFESAVNTYAEGSRPASALMGVCCAVPFAFVGRRPLPAAATVFGVLWVGAGVLPADTFNNLVFAFVAFLAAVWATGAAGEWRVAVAGLALALAGVVAVQLILGEDAGAMLSTGVIAGAVWVAAFVFGRRTHQTRELRERTALLESTRDSEARAAVAEERTRIAREMHDVVAHSISVMVVQAEAAAAMLDTDPERARRPLAAVQDTGRAALTELRRMLGVLREIADEGADLAPQTGLAGLDALVGHVREAGLPVEVTVAGDPRPLPPGIDLSAFRIVQEGLTNALKHAGPARASVRLEYIGGDLVLEVSDDGRGHDPDANGGGHGLLGMRERVALYGGEIDAGPLAAPAHGFALRARLPIDGVVA